MSSISRREYEIVPGFFSQNDSNHPVIDPIPPRFGLLDTTDGRWANFVSSLHKLNAESNPSASYKVFFFARHGQGFHNVAEAKYGTKAWDEYWAMLDGDGDLVWGPDPELTELGKSQALSAREVWTTEMAYSIPLPEKMYCSPLTRALQTWEITFKGVISDEQRRATVLENCREEYGEHTCDKRRTKSYILSTFPGVDVEEGFSEEDNLWTLDFRESATSAADRAKEVLDMIFKQDKETFICITAHGGIINGFLACLGEKKYPLPTGGILPVVIKSDFHAMN